MLVSVRICLIQRVRTPLRMKMHQNRHMMQATLFATCHGSAIRMNPFVSLNLAVFAVSLGTKLVFGYDPVVCHTEIGISWADMLQNRSLRNNSDHTHTCTSLWQSPGTGCRFTWLSEPSELMCAFSICACKASSSFS
jgi:hypothetical protein